MAGCDRATAGRLLDAVANEAWRIERKFSRYIEGNIIDRINRSQGAPVSVDEETAKLLHYASELHALSGGRFDITSGVLRAAWRFDGTGRLPRAKTVRRLMKRVGWQRASWREPELRLRPGMEIDLGGIGKEYAADRAGVLAAEIWPHVLVNFGGDLVATGHGIDGSGWRVGVEGLCATNVPVPAIELVRGGVATSGDTRRYLIDSGKRYGHILDARTGWPVKDAPHVVTVLAQSCTEAGMLATFAMLQGPEAEAFLRAQDVKFWCQRA